MGSYNYTDSTATLIELSTMLVILHVQVQKVFLSNVHCIQSIHWHSHFQKMADVECHYSFSFMRNCQIEGHICHHRLFHQEWSLRQCVEGVYTLWSDMHCNFQVSR